MEGFIDIIIAAGYIGIIGAIFAESGLFFGFFLPGDSLLFTAGLLASQGHFNLWVLATGCFIAAVLGDSVGYSFGRRVGPHIFTREDSFFFQKKHLQRTARFYEKYGRKTILLARVVPIVRTFAPIFAGVGAMPYRVFLFYNVLGGFVWTFGILCIAYYLGATIPTVGEYLEWIILGIIVLSFVPIAWEIYLEKRRSTNEVS